MLHLCCWEVSSLSPGHGVSESKAHLTISQITTVIFYMCQSEFSKKQALTPNQVGKGFIEVMPMKEKEERVIEMKDFLLLMQI